jgi:glycosyltransferase involved in cell wall biosynthesis
MTGVISHLISIITPTRNAEGTLAETLESVGSRNFPDVEHLLIDALSSDGTLAIAAQYPRLKIISERDRGIYDGMNKGARLASGEWLLFLQADDWLPEGTLESYRRAIRENPGAEMICGSAEALKFSSGIWKRVWSVDDVESKKLTIRNIALREPMINARLIRRDCFGRRGGFSLDYALASDRDFLLRAAEQEVCQIEIPAMVYRYRWHSGSSTMTEGNQLTGRLSSENLLIAKKHLAAAPPRDRKVLKKWHTRLTVQSAMNALEQGRWGDLTGSIAAGTKADICWIFELAREIISSLPGFLLRGGKTRSQLLQGAGK